MTERCLSCVGNLKMMCDQAFANTADQMNDMAAYYDDEDLGLLERAGEVLDFVADAQGSSFRLLMHALQGPNGYGCGLSEGQIKARLDETREFRRVTEI